MSRQYVVTINGAEDANYASTVRAALEGGLPFSLYVDTVVPFDPENLTPLRQVPAIKRIRTLLGSGLKDSKFLTDTAKALGSAQWGNVVIKYNHADDTYTVADHRP